MMFKFLLGGAVAAIVAGGVAFAQVAPAPGQPGARGHAMQTEARTDVQAHVGKMFARLDTNRDGFVTKAEADAVEAQREAKFKDRAEKRASRFDPAKMFDRLDGNHDGKITQAEADAAHNARIQAKGGQPAKAHAGAMSSLFARADTNKDGSITRAEFDALGAQLKGHMEQAALHHGGAGRLFETADANKDGKVSVAEAQSVALQHFDRADLNHDGKLTPDERKAARQQLRAEHRPS
jgi:Ca2+-binding EF-hand superfamily protein